MLPTVSSGKLTLKKNTNNNQGRIHKQPNGKKAGQNVEGLPEMLTTLFYLGIFFRFLLGERVATSCTTENAVSCFAVITVTGKKLHMGFKQ